MTLRLEDGQLSAIDIPQDGILVIIEKDKIGYWQLGNIDKDQEQCGMALYRLLSYFSGDGAKVSRAVDQVTGRLN